jgi:hypothetical protein
MANCRYNVVLTAAYSSGSYAIFCGSSSTWAEVIVRASAVRTSVRNRQVPRSVAARPVRSRP